MSADDDELELDASMEQEAAAPPRVFRPSADAPLGPKYGFCPVCNALPPPEARFCTECGTGLEIHASDYFVERTIRATVPGAARRDGFFHVYLGVGDLERDVPDGLPGAEQAEGTGMPGQVPPEIVVYVRADLFEVLPHAPLRVLLRNPVKLPLTVKLAAGQEGAPGPGRCAVDVYYCDECLYQADFELPLEDAADAPDGEVVVYLRKLFPSFVARACQLATERIMHGHTTPDVGRLPTPVSIPGYLMQNLRTMAEYAAWIPRVLEAFLRYHVCVMAAAGDVELPSSDSLEDLREAFHRALTEPGVEELVQQLPYLKEYRKFHYQQLTRSLVDYQLRIWDEPAMFPNEDQCAELARTYRPKLDAVLSSMVEMDSLARLVVKGDDGQLMIMPAPAEDPATLFNADDFQAEVVYLWAGERLFPLEPLVRYQVCPRCGGRHVFLWAGGGEEGYTEVPGSCPYVQPADLLRRQF